MQMGDVAGEGQVLQLLQGAGDFNFLFWQDTNVLG